MPNAEKMTEPDSRNNLSWNDGMAHGHKAKVATPIQRRDVTNDSRGFTTSKIIYDSRHFSSSSSAKKPINCTINSDSWLDFTLFSDIFIRSLHPGIQM